uniref:Uncharacterized protein n=1 Tax=Periophthalmus magnuspinnatus TaxID=409849 RepID=A0A3B3ZXC6_9GOBI
MRIHLGVYFDSLSRLYIGGHYSFSIFVLRFADVTPKGPAVHLFNDKDTLRDSSGVSQPPLHQSPGRMHLNRTGRLQNTQNTSEFDYILIGSVHTSMLASSLCLNSNKQKWEVSKLKT